MSTTQPIRSIEDIQKFKAYYLKKGEYRNYLLVTVCLNTGLRICDILRLRWDDIVDFKTHTVKKYLCVKEQKTGKTANISINKSIVEAVDIYKAHIAITSGYIFANRNNKPISRVFAYQIISEGGKGAGLPQKISCHSLRKTFGYQAWQKDTPPALLMSLFNHSSFEITKRYLGIEQDDKDKVYNNINL